MIKTIDISSRYKKVIHLDKIKPFINKCKVTEKDEFCNVEVWYTPNNSVIELGSYREFFKETKFNEFIETLAEEVYSSLATELKPAWLKVRVYLEDDSLTPWDITIDSNNL